jgi:hypothetical protein
MVKYCFRITFQTEQAAFYQFHVFPPLEYLPWVGGRARKRSGNSQLIVIEMQSEVLKIEEIHEEDFTAAPSHEV